MTNATNEQMELGFNHGTVSRGIYRTRREGRIARAAWWFAQMRDMVERAMEPAMEPRPEQIWIPGAMQEVKV